MPNTILVFAEYGWRNGGENSWLCVANQLKSSYQFVVACPLQTELSATLGEIGIGCVEWNVQNDDGTRKTQAEIREEIASLILAESPGLVHCNSLATSRLVGPVTAELGIPSVGYLRDILKLSRKAIEDINCIDAIIAVSEATMSFHVERGVAVHKTRFIHNGIDLSEFAPSEPAGFIHHELSLPSSVRLLMCVGQIGMRKGTDIVIESFLKLEKSFDDLALLLVGIRNSVKDEAVEFEEKCRRLAAESSRVFWLGRRTDVSQIMKEATLLLHGARQEPFGRVMLESLGVGLPFVATDVGGTREMVDGVQSIDGADAGSLLICQPDSVDSMAFLAARFLGDEALRQNVTAILRRHAEESYGISRCAERLKEVYRKLLNGE